MPGGLTLPVRRGRILGIPIPRIFLPVGETTETVDDGRMCFDIRLSLPGLGPMVQYRGWLAVPEESE